MNEKKGKEILKYIYCIFRQKRALLIKKKNKKK